VNSFRPFTFPILALLSVLFAFPGWEHNQRQGHDLLVGSDTKLGVAQSPMENILLGYLSTYSESRTAYYDPL
jgi:hypothetical protein